MNAEYGRHMAKPGSVLVSPGAAGGTAAALATQTLGRSKMLSSKPYEVRSTFFLFSNTKTIQPYRRKLSLYCIYLLEESSKTFTM